MSQVAAEQAAQDLIEVSAETKSTEQDLAELRGPQQQTLDTITISEQTKTEARLRTKKGTGLRRRSCRDVGDARRFGFVIVWSSGHPIAGAACRQERERVQSGQAVRH